MFSTHTARQQREQEAPWAEPYEEVGRLKMELEWLKKGKLPNDIRAKRAMIEPIYPELSVRCQCELQTRTLASCKPTPVSVILSAFQALEMTV